MSELSEAISEMRNMRESYDQIGAAAEAYNTGKAELAANINSKGVQASATETLPELAEKVAAISQETYEIDGGEMYAKQLFGSLTTPNYWNLYDIMAQLLSDGRLVNYGGILLAEYYKGYDSLALSGAGAGGAYVVSDKDENGQFKMYTEDTTHTWATEFDGKGNRWVAYCFAEEYHDFQITDTNTSPRSIFIGRKVGTITSLVNARISQIVVPDGAKLHAFHRGSYTQNFGKSVVFNNFELIDQNALVNDSAVEQVYIQADIFTSAFSTGCANLKCAIIEGNDVTTALETETVPTFIIKSPKIRGSRLGANPATIIGNNATCKYLYLISEDVRVSLCFNNNFSGLAYLGYIDNDKSKTVGLYKGERTITSTDLILQDGWCKPLIISDFASLTESNMYSRILQRLKQDEPDCGDGVTITLGQTNLDKLTSQESIDLLDELTNTYGYTFA